MEETVPIIRRGPALVLATIGPRAGRNRDRHPSPLYQSRHSVTTAAKAGSLIGVGPDHFWAFLARQDFITDNAPNNRDDTPTRAELHPSPRKPPIRASIQRFGFMKLGTAR